MIKLQKSNEPAVLTTSTAAWTAEYLADIAKIGQKAKAKPSRYAHPDIKSALLKETHEKCAYCESKFGHIAYGDVEHIIGKKTDPNLAYEWSNLTIACDICNTNKGDTTGLLDPYETDPADVLRFHGPWMTFTFGNAVARVTVIVIQLNRTKLLEKRKEKLDELANQIEIVHNTKDDSVRALLLECLVSEVTGAASEYSACLSWYLNDLKQSGAL